MIGSGSPRQSSSVQSSPVRFNIKSSKPSAPPLLTHSLTHHQPPTSPPPPPRNPTPRPISNTASPFHLRRSPFAQNTHLPSLASLASSSPRVAAICTIHWLRNVPGTCSADTNHHSPACLTLASYGILHFPSGEGEGARKEKKKNTRNETKQCSNSPTPARRSRKDIHIHIHITRDAGELVD